MPEVSTSKPSKIGIAGGGLAGLLAAKWIKEKNLEIDIDLFERRKKEKYRIDCAEALLNQRNAFERVGNFVKPFITNKLKKVQWRMMLRGEEKVSTIHYSNACWMINRLAWQKRLIEEIEGLGVNMKFGSRVNPERMDYDLVIDARGSVGGEYCATGVYGVFSGDFGEIADTSISEIRENSDIYCWIFPVNSSLANIGCGSYEGRVKRTVLEEYISHVENLGLGIKIEEEVKKGAGFVDYSYGALLYHGKEKIVAERNGDKDIVRIGDAAGLADPLSGEGMTGAISSAHLLGFCLSNYRNDYIFKYVELLRKENEFLGKNMAVMLARRDYFEGFVKFMSLLDGVDGKYLNSKLFVLRYPLKALKLRFM